MKRPDGLDKPRAKKIIRAMSTANTWVYRRSGGRVGRKWRVMAGFRKPVDMLLLTTTGRRSGQPRTAPLIYMQDAEDFIVVASRGGLAGNPDWYHNLVDDPEVEVQLGARVMPMVATEVDADERARLWPRLNEVYADFDTYQGWTERTIPVIRLSSRSTTSG